MTIAALLKLDSISSRTVNEIIRILRDTTKSVALRGLCAIAIGKFGNAAQLRILRHHFSDEPSDYTRGSILFASRYFPSAERRTCLASWGSHSTLNSFIARSVQSMIRS